jgi:hypothetical protein
MQFISSTAFDLVSHTLLVYRLSTSDRSGFLYINLFWSYLTNRHSQVRASGILFSYFEVNYHVSQGSIMGPLHFNVSIYDLCGVITYTRYLLCADYIESLCTNKSPEDCNLL